VSPWYTRQDRDRDHDSVWVRAFALEALEQLRASFSAVADSALVLIDKTAFVLRAIPGLRIAAFVHGYGLLRCRRRCLPFRVVVNSLRRAYHVVANSLLVWIIRLSPRREDVNGGPRKMSFAVNLRRCLCVPL
jgi:hypothetical protein